jgi:hypothetical protein
MWMRRAEVTEVGDSADVLTQEPDVFSLPEDSPLRDDLADILNRKLRGEITLLSHTEVWDE